LRILILNLFFTISTTTSHWSWSGKCRPNV